MNKALTKLNNADALNRRTEYATQASDGVYQLRERLQEECQAIERLEREVDQIISFMRQNLA